MRFLTNHANPETFKPWDLIRGFEQSEEDALREFESWLKDKIVGEPRATESYSVEELKDMGMVGIYAKDDED
ncbi:MAG: hypothetical protein AAGG02_10820 [Cyanobacteria bacterium P01_H01_bin.15]